MLTSGCSLPTMEVNSSLSAAVSAAVRSRKVRALRFMPCENGHSTFVPAPCPAGVVSADADTTESPLKVHFKGFTMPEYELALLEAKWGRIIPLTCIE